MVKVNELELHQELGNLSPKEFAEIKNLKEELDKILFQEKCHWWQRSRIQWFQEGDSDTAFFHRIANFHRRQNLINGRQTEDRWIRDGPELRARVDTHFATLFGGNSLDKIMLLTLICSPILNRRIWSLWNAHFLRMRLRKP